MTIATNMAGRGTDILLGGNPEFLARSEMENEWINRAAKLPTQGAARYEDSLRELREKYDEEVQRAEKKFIKDSEAFDQQRGEALKRTTELQREIRGISPFRRSARALRRCVGHRADRSLAQCAADPGRLPAGQGEL